MDITRKHQLTTPFAELERIASALLGAMADRINAGDLVRIPGIGTLSVYAGKPRTGRNPRTGEPIAVPARPRYKLKPSSIAARRRQRAYMQRRRATRSLAPVSPATNAPATEAPVSPVDEVIQNMVARRADALASKSLS